MLGMKHSNRQVSQLSSDHVSLAQSSRAETMSSVNGLLRVDDMLKIRSDWEVGLGVRGC